MALINNEGITFCTDKSIWKDVTLHLEDYLKKGLESYIKKLLEI